MDPTTPSPGERSQKYFHLHGFLRGSRAPLYEKGHELINLDSGGKCPPSRLADCSLRTRGFYGSLVNVNAYHQRGVAAGKNAATQLLDLEARARATLPKLRGRTAEAVTRALKADPKDVYRLLGGLAANDDSIGRTSAEEPAREHFFLR